MRTVAAVLALVACVHAGLWASLRTKEAAPDFTGQLASVSYAPFVASAHPDWGERPTVEQIRADLKAIAPYTRAIRTYSSTGGAELVPPIAAEFGLKVTVGAWIDKNQERNEREIRSALDLARHNSNVNAIVVGNETVLRNETSVADLIKLIQRVKKSSPVPVTTGENWSLWVDHPELASSVDFIAAHILPYWSGVDASKAVDHTIEIYDKLRRLHPGKRIVIAEFGWPSAGYNFRDANPGRMEQAVLLRDFVRRAEAYGIDYNVIEAIDQPWKTAEGGVGPYWGLLDASREPKFSWTGPIADPDYIKQAGLAVLFGILLSLPILAIRGCDRGAGVDAFGFGQPGRGLGCGHRRVLDRPLFCLRSRLCAWARRDPVGAAGSDRAGANRRDRSYRLWARAAPARRCAAVGAGSLCAESIDSHSGLP